MTRVRIFGNKFSSPQFSDLEFKCREATFGVHRAAVCRSVMMRDECEKGEVVRTRVRERSQCFADTLSQINGKTIVVATDHHAINMERLFEFFYDEKYTIPYTDDPADSLSRYCEENPLLVHVKVREVAEFYDIPELQAQAMNNFAVVADSLKNLDAEMFTKLLQRIYLTKEVHIPLFDKVLEMAFKHKQVLLNAPVFTNAIVSNTKLQQFAKDFCAGLPAHFEDDLNQELGKQHAQQDVVEETLKRTVDELDGLKIKLDQKIETIRKQKDTKAELKLKVEQLTKERDECAKNYREAIYKVQVHERTLKSREAELKTARENADTARAELTAANQQLTKRPSQPSGVQIRRMRYFDSLYRCRTCLFAPFKFYFDESDAEEKVARCKFCTTRHHYNGT